MTQLDLFGGPEIAVAPTTTPIESTEPEAELETPVLEGQLDLLAARATRLSPVAALLGEGLFAEAAGRCAAMRGEEVLAEALARLATTLPADDALATWIADAPPEAFAPLDALAPAAIATAARRGRFAFAAARLDETAPGATLEGRLAGELWLHARHPERARASFEASIAANHHLGRAHASLGNLRWEKGRRSEAREHWSAAFARDPDGAALVAIADPEVASLLDDAEELRPPPAAQWVVIVGVLRGLWALPPPGDLANPEVRAFGEALVRSRAASARAATDLDARRTMKRLAPELLGAMLEEGKA